MNEENEGTIRKFENEENALKTCTKNASVDINEGYHTHTRKSMTIGIVQTFYPTLGFFIFYALLVN
jgi:hypothetical protein